MIRKDKRSNFGGKLGEEFNALWDAIITNQIIPADGLETKQTSSGTVLKPKVETGTSEPAGQQIVHTKVARYKTSKHEDWDNNSALGEGNRWDWGELWFNDVDGRIIALPPVDGITIIKWVQAGVGQGDWEQDDWYHSTLFGVNGMNVTPRGPLQFQQSNGSATVRWPDHDGLKRNGGTNNWELTPPYYAGGMNDQVFCLSLTNPLWIPLNPNGIVAESDFDTHYTKHSMSSLDPNEYIQCDYIDINLHGRVWKQNNGMFAVT